MSENIKIHTCETCGKTFKHRSGPNKYCGLSCSGKGKSKQKAWWVPCSICLASVGFGIKKTGQILCMHHSSVRKQWRQRNVHPKLPPTGSWRLYAQRASKGHGWDCKEYIKARKKDIRKAHSKGFTWIYIWQKEQAIRRSVDRYANMSDDEKKLHNKRCSENRVKRLSANPELENEYRKKKKEWRKLNPEKIKSNRKRWVEKNPGKASEYRKNMMQNNPAYRAKENQRKRFKSLMKTVKKGGSMSYSNYLGCTTRELKIHLESQFTSRMSWDNYGEYWHVDHILPCASFDLEDGKQMKQCWHWTNLQPLEAQENMAKSDNIENPQMKLLIEFT